MPNSGHKEDLRSDILVREGGHVYSLGGHPLAGRLTACRIFYML